MEDPRLGHYGTRVIRSDQRRQFWKPSWDFDLQVCEVLGLIDIYFFEASPSPTPRNQVYAAMKKVQVSMSKLVRPASSIISSSNLVGLRPLCAALLGAVIVHLVTSNVPAVGVANHIDLGGR